MDNFLAYTNKQSYYSNETINIYTHYPSLINFQNTFNMWIPNQKITIIKQDNSLKIILNQITSTPGILLSKVKIISNIIRINYDIDISGFFTVNPFIRDLSSNVYYWLNNTNNVIELTNKYIIIQLPNSLINNFINIYLLAFGDIKLFDSFILNNFSIYFYSNTIPKPLEIKLLNDQKKIIDNKILYSNNIIDQKFNKY